MVKKKEKVNVTGNDDNMRLLDVTPLTRVTRHMAKTLQESATAAAASGGGTTSSSSTSSSSVKPAANVQGQFLCVCDSFFLTLSDQMLECSQCKSWSHASCMGIDALHLPLVRKTFVCQFCTGEARSRKRGREAALERLPKMPLLKLTEVPDKVPSNFATLKDALDRLLAHAVQQGFDISFYGCDSPPPSDTLIEQSLTCCAHAIHEATFSESYPAYCLNELRSPPNKYLQGSFMRCRTTHRVVSLVLSNGMDQYGSLRSTITQIRTYRSQQSKDPNFTLPPFTERCLAIADVSGFVHLNLIATHPSYRGRGLAKMLIAAELIRWAMRGRTEVYLNMALDKRTENKKLVCSVSPASKRLYDTFEFHTVFQRPIPRSLLSSSQYSKLNSNGDGEHFTAKEADMGRVLANLDFVECVLSLVDKWVVADKTPKIIVPMMTTDTLQLVKSPSRRGKAKK